MSSKKGTYPSTFIFFVLLVAYYVLDMLFPMTEKDLVSSNRVYPQVAMGVIFVYSSFYLLLNLFKLNTSRQYKSFILLTFWTLLYIPFVVKGSSLYDNFIQFMKINTGGVLFIGVALSLRKNPNKTKWLYRLFAIQLIYGFYCLVHDYYMVVITSVIDNGEGIFDSNAGFVLASLLPMCLILPNKKMRIITYVIICVACLFSGQRAATLAAAVSVPFALKYFTGVISKKTMLFWGGILIIIALPIIESSIDNLLLRQEIDANKGQMGSGRSEFWAITLESFFDGSLLSMLFGNGYFSINNLLLQKYGIAIGAHNGFIDHLYSFGIIGLCIYLSIFISLFSFYLSAKKMRAPYANIVLIILLLFFVRSATSHGFLDVSYIPFFLPLAIFIEVDKPMIQKNRQLANA